MSDSEFRVGAGASLSRLRVDLNADLGEGFPHDRELVEIVSSVSVSCGAHAGDPGSIRDTLYAAEKSGVAVGAHPGYPDREGFGRRSWVVASEQVRDLIRDQVQILQELAKSVGCAVQYLKPHGALYNQAQREDTVARGVLLAARELNLPLLGQPGILLQRLASEADVRFIPEGFPDRRSREDGSLVPRGEPGAVLADPHEIEAQAILLVEKHSIATLCIHGDEPAAVSNARLVRSALERRGVSISSFLGQEW